jgi:hypothetical protein
MPNGLQGIVAQVSEKRISSSLRSVAKTFGDLQEDRHRADYDVSVTFDPQDVLSKVKPAEQAFEHWRMAVESDPLAKLYLLLLLTGKDTTRGAASR